MNRTSRGSSLALATLVLLAAMANAQEKKAEDADAAPALIEVLRPNVDDKHLFDEPVFLYNCPIRPLFDVRVPVRVAGVLEEVKVKEGSQVTEGQVIAKVDDRLARIELEAKSAAAHNVAPIDTARAREVEAKAQLDDAEKLYKKRVLPEEEFRVKQAQFDIAKYGVVDAIAAQAQMKIEEKAAAAQVNIHSVTSPIHGVVVQQVRQQGEAVQALDPIFRVIRTDVVRIEASLQIRDAYRVKKGMTIEVYPNSMAGETILFLGHTGPVNAVRVLADGKRCVSGGSDGQIIVWDIVRGKQGSVLSEHAGPVQALAINPKNENILISGGADRMLRVWDVFQEKSKHTIQTPASILCAVVHPIDPKFVVTGHEDRRIRVWNLETRALVRTLEGHTNYVTSVSITPDGKTIFSAGNDQSVRIWNFDDGKDINKLTGRSAEVTQIGINRDGKNFLFNNYGLLQVRSLPYGEPVVSFENRIGTFSGVAVFSPVEELVLAGSDNRQLQLWAPDPAGRYPRLARIFEGHTDPVLSVDFAPDGSYFVSGSADRSVRIWRCPKVDQLNRERKRAKIEFVNQQVEAGSQTLTMYAEVDNKDGLLNPGAFATIVVYPDDDAIQASK